MSTPTFSLSTPVENSEATWKKATKCNKFIFYIFESNKNYNFHVCTCKIPTFHRTQHKTPNPNFLKKYIFKNKSYLRFIIKLMFYIQEIFEFELRYAFPGHIQQAKHFIPVLIWENFTANIFQNRQNIFVLFYFLQEANSYWWLVGGIGYFFIPTTQKFFKLVTFWPEIWNDTDKF